MFNGIYDFKSDGIATPYVGAGICASNEGAVAGSETTGPELNRIEDALGII